MSGALIAGERSRRPVRFSAPEDARSAALLAPSAPGRAPMPAGARGRGSVQPAGGPGQPTLDVRLAALWRELTAGMAVACPLCGGMLQPRYAAHAAPVGGRCRDCGSTIE